MTMKVWTINLDNYEGDTSSVYFKNFEDAKATFDFICNKHKKFSEFDMEFNEKSNYYYCSWFDARYNEYSTYVSLKSINLNIFEKSVEI